MASLRGPNGRPLAGPGGRPLKGPTVTGVASGTYSSANGTVSGMLSNIALTGAPGGVIAFTSRLTNATAGYLLLKAGTSYVGSPVAVSGAVAVVQLTLPTDGTYRVVLALDAAGTQPLWTTGPIIVGTGVAASEAITLNNPGAQEAGASFALTGSIASSPASPVIQILLGGTALSGSAAISGSSFSFLVPGQSAGTVPLQAKDTSTGLLSNTVNVTVQASNSGATTVATGGGTPSGTLGAVPTFRLQAKSGSAIAVGDPIELGHAFARSHVPSGLINALQVSSGGATAAVQVDQANHWPADGSLRYASLSFYSPVAVAAGGTATLTFSAASSNLSGNALTAAGLAALSDFNLQVSGFDYGSDVFTTHVNDITANLTQWNTSTGYGTNPLGGWRYTRLGPVVTEVEAWRMMKRVSDGASHRWVKVRFYARVWQLPGGGHHFECLPSLRQDQLYSSGHPGGTAGPATTTQKPFAGNAVLLNGSTALAYYGGSSDPRTVTTDATVFNVSAGTISSSTAANTVKSWAWDMNARYSWGATPIVFSGSGVPSGITQGSIYYLSAALYLIANRANSLEYDGTNKISMGSAGSGSVTVTPVAMTTPSGGWFGALRDASIPWVGNGGYARPRYMVAHDATYLFRKTRLLPPYQLNLNVPNYNDVHGTKGFSLGRPAVCGNINDYGDDPDDLRIGYMSRHQINLALNPFDPVRELITLSMGFAQADMQIWASDFRTGLPVNGSADTVSGFASNAGFFMDNELRTDGTSTSYPFAGWDFSKDYYQWSYDVLGDPSHYPWYITMPLLRTGHAAFQELMEAVSNLLVLTGLERSPPNQSQLTGLVDTYHNGGNIRSVGWFLRSVGCGDRFTDDASPVRSLTRYNLAQQANFVAAGHIQSNISAMNMLGLPYITTNVSPLAFHLFFHYHAMQGMAMEAWVNDYNWSAGVANNFGISDAMDSNLDYYVSNVYDFMMTDTSGNYYTSIADAYHGPSQSNVDGVATTYPNNTPSSTSLWAYDTHNDTRFLAPGNGQAGLGGAIEYTYLAGLAMCSWPDSNPIPNALRVYNHIMTRISTAPFVGYVWTGAAGQGGESDCWSTFAIAPLGS